MSAPSQSLEKLEKICSKNPTSILFARLAEGFLQQGNVKRAADICRQGLRYRPSYVAGHVVMGKCHLAVAHFEEARQEFQKVLQLDADHPAALWHLGQIDLQLGWEDLALRHFELALQLDPLNGRLIDQIAQLKPDTAGQMQATPSRGEGVETETSAEEVESSVVDVAHENVVTLQKNDDFREEDASSLDGGASPPELVVDENLSSLVSELAQDRKVVSEDTCDEANKEDAVGIATATLAELYAQQGLVEQAVTTLEQVLARDPSNMNVQARLKELRS